MGSQINLNLHIYETKKFGLNIKSPKKSVDDLIVKIKERMYDYFTQETKLKRQEYRKPIKDERFHCCLYMIPSVYTPFRAIDIYTLKLLHRLVPIVLVVARSDSLTQKER